MSKYNAKRTTIDGITFASRKEADCYVEIKLLQHAGEIKDFSLQPEFELQAAFTDSNGVKHRAIRYIADFLIYHNDLKQEVVDVKGHKTKDYLIKKKLFLAKYPQYKFTEA